MTRLQEIDRILTSLDNDINELVGQQRKLTGRILSSTAVSDTVNKKLEWCTTEAEKLKSEKLSIQLFD